MHVLESSLQARELVLMMEPSHGTWLLTFSAYIIERENELFFSAPTALSTKELHSMITGENSN